MVEKRANKMEEIALEQPIMNAPYFDNSPLRRSESRERRYPFLCLLDTLLGWSIGLSALAVSLYVVGRFALFFFPHFLDWMRL